MKITIRDLQKSYGGHLALSINALTLNSGEVIGVVGNNGAGKTTFLRLLLDLIKPDKGTILSNEYVVNKDDAWKEYTLSYLDEGFLMDFLTPDEFFYFIGNVYGQSKQEIDQQLIKYESFYAGEIFNNRNKLIREFSTGNRQKIGVLSVLIIQPQVIVLDEPFNSLDPSSQIILKDILKNYSHPDGAIVIVSSHDLSHIADMASRILVIEKGHLGKDILSNPQVLSELNNYFAISVLL